MEKTSNAKPTRILDCTDKENSGLKRSRIKGARPECAKLLVDKLNPKRTLSSAKGIGPRVNLPKSNIIEPRQAIDLSDVLKPTATKSTTEDQKSRHASPKIGATGSDYPEDLNETVKPKSEYAKIDTEKPK